MFLWRISNHEGLDGRGGLLASARWHTQGRPIVYLATSPAGALTEMLVNMQLRRIAPASFAEGWKDDLALSRGIGDDWLWGGESALLEVPSAILPDTFNVLLNPVHPEAGRIR